MIYKLLIKRATDMSISLIFLIIFLPVLLFVSFSLFLANRGDIFFTQIRPGKDGKLFKIIKFKTMNDKRDEIGNLLPDNLRLTKIGRLVRKTSLDELPQLINVLKGDMSLVGPRPLLVEYLPLYNKLQNRRHEVRPGITGWAQVNGRNTISWEKKFDYDVWYVDNISMSLDIRIFLLTILKVFRTEGINQNNEVTMGAFTGDNL
jgi:lipopolysaccharide/colanic/teichoic acid biosynthesis glycosyltransferase